ncbi:MAG: hypothetical protein PHF54_02805, partial [Candidatus Pacebacteria bacterium]|nr:hypothetical protein [Candidatus Paceibacterota bacterium]
SPTGTTLVERQAIAPLAKYTLVNSDSVEAKITKVELQRTGVSADTTLKNVYLYDGDTRLTDAATISQGKVTFNNPNGVIVIPAGTSKVITVVSDIDAETSGQTVGVSLTGLTANVDLKSTMPITGGIQTIATATLASVTVTTASVTPATSTINAGTSNYTVFSAPIQVNQRAVNFKGLSLKMIGSIPTDALGNIQLYVNGVAAGNATVIDSNNMVRFNLATPVVLQSGSSTLEVRANVVKGSSRNFTFSLENAADLVVVDSVYNVNVLATGIPASTGTISIAAGTVSVTTDPTFNTTTVTGGVSNATLAKYNFKAFGEDVKISYLRVNSSRTLDNMIVYVNGAAVTSSQNVTGGTPVNFSLGSSLIVPANTTVSVEVRGDTKASGVNMTNGSIAITLKAYGSNNAQGVTSSSMSQVPSSDVSSQTLYISSGAVSLSLSSGFASGVIAPNTANQKIGSYVIQATDAESIRISNVSVELAATDINNLSNLYIKYGSTQSTPIAPQTTNNFPVNIEVAKNQSLVVDVYADAGNTTTATVANTDTTQDFNAVNTTATAADGDNASSSSVYSFVGAGTASITVNGLLVTAPAATDTATTVTNIVNALNSNPSITSGWTVSSTTTTVAGDTVVLTRKVAGAAGNFPVVTSTTSGTFITTTINGTDNTTQVSTLTPSGVIEIGDTFTAGITGTTVTFTATADTRLNVATGVANLWNANSTLFALANATVTGGAGSEVVTLTAKVSGTDGAFIAIASAANGTHSANSTVRSTLGMNATGISSNSTITVAAQAGQLMTISSPTLDTPSLAVSSSPAAQYVLASSEMIVANYHFKANNGSVNVTEAKFSVATTGTVTHITVDGKEVPVIGGIATVTGMNFNIPAGNTGRNLPVTVKYNTVGQYGGTVANTVSAVTLTDVKYVAGNTTTSIPAIGATSRVMRVVGGIPTVSLNASTRSNLSSGSTLLAEVTVSALSNGGPIQVKQLSTSSSMAGITGGAPTLGNFTLKVGSETIAVTGTVAGGKVILDNAYTVTPGNSVKFEVYGDLDLAGGTMTSNASVTTSLGAAANFLWNDVEGAKAGAEAGGDTGLNGTLVNNYSTTTTSVVRNY